MAKARKSKAKKSARKTKKSAKRAALSSRRTKSKKSSRRPKAASRKKAAPRKAKKAAPKKKQQMMGEGDYAASRTFLKDQSDFVKRNKAKIPEMGKEAERALDGPEGDGLRQAEQEAMNRSTIE